MGCHPLWWRLLWGIWLHGFPTKSKQKKDKEATTVNCRDIPQQALVHVYFFLETIATTENLVILTRILTQFKFLIPFLEFMLILVDDIF